MTNSGRVTIRVAVAAMMLLGGGVCLRAQSVQGYSFVYYDPDYDWVGAVGVTYPDYSTQYYYKPKVNLSLSGTDGFYDSFYCNPSSMCDYGYQAWAGLTAPPTPGATYTVTAYHSVEVYYRYGDINSGCTYGCYDWYDAFGYSFDQCSPECKADPSCFCVDVWGMPDNWYWYAPMIAVLVYLGEQGLGDSSDEMTLDCTPNPIPPIPQGVTSVTYNQTQDSAPPFGALGIPDTARGATIAEFEDFNVDITAYYDQSSSVWKAKVTTAELTTTKWWSRLRQGEQEAAVSAATQQNVCNMIVDLDALGATSPSNWYMIAAVNAHEAVHYGAEVPDSLNPKFSIMRSTIESLSVPHACGKDASQAKNDIRAVQAYQNAISTAKGDARAAYEALPDPSSATRAAERAIVNPRIQELRSLIIQNRWPACP